MQESSELNVTKVTDNMSGNEKDNESKAVDNDDSQKQVIEENGNLMPKFVEADEKNMFESNEEKVDEKATKCIPGKCPLIMNLWDWNR